MSDYDEYDEPGGIALPYDEGAERAALGAMLLSERQIAVISQIAKPEDFHVPRHEELAAAIYRLHDDGQQVDAVTLADHLLSIGRIDKIGGAAYLHTLMDSVPVAANGPHYAEIVRKRALQRLMVTVGRQVANAGAHPGTDLQDIPDVLTAAIDRLGNALSHVPDSGILTTGELLDGALDAAERIDATEWIHTGFPDIDDIYLGHAPGHLILIGARPSVGKTLFALDLARNAAIVQRVPTLFVSLEMSSGEIMARLLAAQARVELGRIKRATCDDNDWRRLARAASSLVDAPLYIDDAGGVTVAALRNTAKHLQRTTGLGLIIVDYLQMMSGGNADNPRLRVAGIARGLKELATALKVPVIACAQINRGPEQRTDKRPLMSDLTESGEMEAAASTVALLYREEMHERESPRAGEIDVIFAKQRDGQTGTITLAFQGHYARCASFANASEVGAR